MLRTTLSVAIAAGLGFTSLAFGQDRHPGSAGAVFVMTNAADKNEIISYSRAATGAIQQIGRFATGGRGSGGSTDPLESQGSLLLNNEHSLLFAVNAGSGTISVFRVNRAQLSLAGVVPSGGSEPNAIAQHGGLVYVLNTGGTSGVAGFRLSENGELSPIPQSVRFLSTNTSGAASLAFSPDGQFLVVTERLTNDNDVFSVEENGTLSPIKLNDDPSAGTFAVTFAPNGVALVAETGPTSAPNGSTISSFSISNGSLLPISRGVPTLGAATCWDAVTPDGRFVYTDNSASGTISGFTVSGNGTLTPLPNTVQATLPGGSSSANLDLAITSDGKFLYTLNAGIGSVGIFAIQNNTGALTSLGSAAGVTVNAGFNGIAAY